MMKKLKNFFESLAEVSGVNFMEQKFYLSNNESDIYHVNYTPCELLSIWQTELHPFKIKRSESPGLLTNVYQ